MNNQRAKLWIAIIIAIAGVAVGLLAIWRNAPAAVEENTAPQSLAAPSKSEPTSADTKLGMNFVQTAAEDRSPDADLLDGAITSAAAQIRSQHAALPPDQQVDRGRLDSLVEEAKRIWRIYLISDYDDYNALMKETGAEFPTRYDPDSEDSRQFWKTLADAFRASPVAPEDVQLRPFVVRGETFQHPTLGQVGMMEAKNRYLLGRSPGAYPEVVYEITLPVQYDDGRYTGPVFFSVWLAWSTDQNRWLIWRMSVADPIKLADVLIRPTY